MGESSKKLEIKIVYKSFLFLLVALVCFVYWWLRPVKTIGHWKIYQEDIQWRDKVAQSFFPMAKPGVGLTQLEKSAVYLKVLENNGVTITHKEVIEEAKRIERNTRNPEHLKKIKKIFNGNESAYFKNYVLPTLVNRVIAYEFFPNNAEIHKKSLAQAQNLILENKTGKQSFTQLAKSLGFPVLEARLSLEEGLVWKDEEDYKIKKQPFIGHSPKKNQQVYIRAQDKLGPQQKQRREVQFWMSEIVNRLRPGEVLSKPINQEGSWLVVQYVGQENESSFKLNIAEVVKLEYGAWLAKEIEKIEN